ncbi:MAG: hypothetical protein K2I93_08805, partial [Oscillospiraceae bacterium]|nr:hypothetical protein [Oscillospiraceae bacterium]
ADLTKAEKQIHGCHREITAKIAELSHIGEKYHCFSDLTEEMDLDFDALLRQAVVEMLQERADIQMAEYMPTGIDFQPDLIARPQETHKLRLISPLKIVMLPDETDYDEEHEFSDEDYDQVHPKLAVHCRREINDFIEQYTEPEEAHRGLMVYYNSDSSVNEKVFSAFPSVEVVNDELVGVLTCEVCGRLDQAEMAELLSWWRGQCSDGYSEGLEQHEIKTADFGEIYVSFWNDSPDWSISTEEEMNNDIAGSEEETAETSDAEQIYELEQPEETDCAEEPNMNMS